MNDGDETSIGCARCGPGTKLIVRTNRTTKKKFLGCPNWPDCPQTQPMPLHVEMELAGAPKLPGI